MTGPNLPTILAFVFTGGARASADLAALAGRAAVRSFNCVSVEGHTSTNDTLLLFANGRAAGRPLLQGEALGRFGDAASAVCGDLARAIAADAEGASHLIVIEVEGLRDDDEARRVAKTVAENAPV